MCEFISNILKFQPFWTVICGVVVFVIIEWVKEVAFDPLRRYKDLKQDIARGLVLYANLYSNPINPGKEAQYKADLISSYEDASLKIRELASFLSGFIACIPKLRLGIPSKENLLKAEQGLIGLSNSFFLPVGSDGDSRYYDSIEDRVKIIKTKLKIN